MRPAFSTTKSLGSPGIEVTKTGTVRPVAATTGMVPADAVTGPGSRGSRPAGNATSAGWGNEAKWLPGASSSSSAFSSKAGPQSGLQGSPSRIAAASAGSPPAQPSASPPRGRAAGAAMAATRRAAVCEGVVTGASGPSSATQRSMPAMARGAASTPATAVQRMRRRRCAPTSGYPSLLAEPTLAPASGG